MSLINDNDNFFLPTNDLESAKDFYQYKLGLAIKFEFPEKGIIAFKVSDNEPAIILQKETEAKPAIWLTVDSVLQAYDDLKDTDIQFLSEPFEMMTGFAVVFKDPSGNRLGFKDNTKTDEIS